MGTEKNWYNDGQVNPGTVENVCNNDNKKSEKEFNRDPWKHRSEAMSCRKCMYYVQKNTVPGARRYVEIGRCRRNAPSIKGYPAVFPTDWCGEHKIDEEKLLLG